MRCVVVVCLTVFLAGQGEARQAKSSNPPVRYGIEADLDTYPQAKPKEALGSALNAIDAHRIDYLLAQLADPAFVDQRVKEQGGKFDNLVRVTTEDLTEDPESVRELRRFLSEGEWTETGATASVKHKDVTVRQAYFRKVGDRWFLENRRQPPK